MSPANGYGTPWIVFDHNRMSVIDDAQPGRLVLEADRRQVDLMWITDVYGGLVMPTFAQSKLWVEITPMAWDRERRRSPKRADCVPGPRRKRPKQHTM